MRRQRGDRGATWPRSWSRTAGTAPANPDAMFRAAVTAEEVLASRLVCAPLRLWMLCSPNEGAAAVVLRAGDGGVQLRAAVLRSHLPGYVLNEGTPMCGPASTPSPRPRAGWPPTPPTPRPASAPTISTSSSARTPTRPASCSPTRSCGCARPAARAELLARAARPRSAGASRSTPAGGLLSKGEPLGASALGQVVELVRQLRGECRRPPGRRRPRRPGPHGRPRRQRQRRDPHPLTPPRPSGPADEYDLTRWDGR